jgi:hypothetical protein
MREHEMRQIVRTLLGQAVRKVVLPASLGLGLALSGCGDRAAVSLDSGVDDAQVEQPAAARYATPFPGPDADIAYPEYAAPFPPDANMAGKYGTPFPKPDADVSAKYAAPFPGDLGPQKDDGQANGYLYSAAMPDLLIEKDAG